MEIAPRISVDKRIHSGNPVITGTRVPVDLIVGQIVGGMTIEDIMREYELERDDVLAALTYANKKQAKRNLFAPIDEIQERNEDTDDEEVEHDELLSPEDEASLAKGLEELNQGKGIKWEEFKKKFKL